MGGDEEEEERDGGEVFGVEGGGISGAYGDSDVRGQSGGEARGEGLGGPGGGGVEEGWDGGAGGAGGGGRFAAEPDRFVEEEEGGGGEEEKKGEVGGGGGGGRRREGRHRGGGACGRCRFGPRVFGVLETRLWAVVDGPNFIQEKCRNVNLCRFELGCLIVGGILVQRLQYLH